MHLLGDTIAKVSNKIIISCIQAIKQEIEGVTANVHFALLFSRELLIYYLVVYRIIACRNLCIFPGTHRLRNRGMKYKLKEIFAADHTFVSKIAHIENVHVKLKKIFKIIKLKIQRD